MTLITNIANEELLYLNGNITGGQYFQTLIQKRVTTGIEGRYATYSVPLFKGQITDPILNEHELQYLQQFFIRRRGKAQGFRWRNPIDYRCTPTKDGVLDQDDATWTIGGVLEPSGVSHAFVTPAKIYSSHGYITKKPISLIRGGTINKYESGVFSGTAVLDATGRFAYGADPVNLSIECLFDTPTWFGQNEWPQVILADEATEKGKYKISQIQLEERILDYSTDSVVIVMPE